MAVAEDAMIVHHPDEALMAPDVSLMEAGGGGSSRFSKDGGTSERSSRRRHSS